MTEKDRILAKVKSVPSLPSVVMKLRHYLNDPDASFDELARVIQYDPGLTANVLQLANSAYFGWAGTISSVKEAIARLGTNRIFQMVLCMSVAPLVSKPVKGYDMDPGSLWEHSIAVAACAEQLAAALKLQGAQEAFTSGLLHDLGKVVLGTFVEVDDESIWEIVESDNLTFNEAERMVLGIDHAEAAAALLEDWHLPAEVVATARWHHEPGKAEAEHRQMVDLIHVADFLCLNQGWGAGADGPKYRLDEKAVERLGVGSDLAEEVVQSIMTGMDDLMDMYKPRVEAGPR